MILHRYVLSSYYGFINRSRLPTKRFSLQYYMLVWMIRRTFKTLPYPLYTLVMCPSSLLMCVTYTFVGLTGYSLDYNTAFPKRNRFTLPGHSLLSFAVMIVICIPYYVTLTNDLKPKCFFLPYLMQTRLSGV